MNDTRPVVIFDLDNCLSNDKHRIGLIRWDSKDPTHRYNDYHQSCDQDAAQNTEVFFGHILAGHVPLFITGRPEAVRAKTLEWIVRNLSWGVANYYLLMRPHGCELTSADLKVMLLETWLVGDGFGRRVINAYDDHAAIVDAYRSAFGIPATVLRIHSEDAYRDSDSIPRRSSSALSRPDQAAADAAAITGGSDDIADGPVQGARPKRRIPASTILRAMADTFDERNAVYRDNSRMIPKLIRALFPHGVPSHLVEQEEFHLFELILVKLARFASTELAHIDSIHDIAPYCAMIETILKEKQQ